VKSQICPISFVLAGLFLVSANAGGQVQAAFSANPLAGCSPLTVQFQDMSSGNPTTWKWDLGNGTISFFQHPSTVYYVPGTYTVKLIVTGAQGTDSVIKQQYINVYGAPSPDFRASDSTGCFPLSVQFTDLTPSSAGPLSAWQWDFGDGNTSSLQNPSHTYEHAGNYTVTLQVTTDKGCHQSIARKQYIRIASGVMSSFTDTATQNCRAPVQVQFAANSTGPGTLSYQWDFGDGSSSSLAYPTHTYTSNGVYTVTLITTSSQRCRDTLRRANLFNIGLATARFTSPDSACAGLAVAINNTSQPSPSTVMWDFGDGTRSTAPTPFKTYPNPGIYTIKLVDSFQNCTDSMTRQIQVLSRPSASFTTGDRYSCSIPFVARFTSNAAPGTTYLWDFGDGGTGTGSNPSHTYTTSGVFTIRLVIAGANGCPDTLTKPGYIHVQPPQININGLPVQGCIPLTITPSASVAVSDGVVAYNWDFGDGTGSTLAAPVKTYAAAGDYTVKLVIRTATGCTDSVIIPHAVLASQKPLVQFTADSRDVCRSSPVRFTNLSAPAGDQWAWDFGDGASSASPDPVHQYSDTGYFTVRLVVWNKGCADTLTVKSFVHINPPVAAFTARFDCNDKYTRTFSNHSTGAQTLQWDFGDSVLLPASGATGMYANPVHKYLQKGIYLVNLTATNGACSDTAYQRVVIADEHLDFQASATEICRGSVEQFSVSGLNPAYTASISWDFGDGTRLPVSALTGPASGDITHTYKKTGWYTVSLFFTDVNGCKDSVVKQRYIHVTGPTADFDVQQAICIGGTVVFRDRSAADSSYPIAQWTWDFGDGTSNTYFSPPFTHNYASAGSYTVGLRITDTKGCMDSIVKPQILLVSSPRAIFAVSDTNTCPGKAIVFSNASTGMGIRYNWSFGDGAGSAQSSPVYAYASDGIYRAGLLITDSLGCKDSASRTINVSTPHAGFDLSDSISNCPPLQVRFTDRSLNYTSVQWDFGDGSVSSLENPVHFYNFPGTYFVKARIVGPGGCTDSVIRQILVRGPQGRFTYSPLTGCKPLAVRLSASIQDKESLIWDFNDGSTNVTQDTVVSHTYKAAGDFLPKMILTDSSGCKVVYPGHDTVKVTGVSCLAAMDTARICDSGFVQFSDHSVANDYITRQIWGFGDGTTDMSGDPRHYYNRTGVFSISHQVITTEGCSDSLSWPDTVKVFRSPGAVISGDSAACVPGVLTFHGGAFYGDTARLSWKWDFGNGQTASVPDPDKQAYPLAGGYLVQLLVTYAGACSNTASRPVNVWPLPNTFAGNDTVECEGRPIQLQATGADSYIWDPAPAASCSKCAGPWIAPATDADYVVTGYSLHGCVKKDTVHVRVRHPFILSVSDGTAICAGQSVTLTASGAERYQWTPVAGLGDPGQSVTRASPDTTTKYEVIGNDNDGCFSDTARINVIVNPIPKVFAGNDTTVITGSTIQLHTVNSADVDRWHWSPGTGLSCYDCPSPQLTVKNTITYWVAVANAGGCTASSSITIHAICNDKNFFVPNTFSPNGDGMNDIFYVRGKGLNNVSSIRIFDRWGQVVFEKRDFPPNDPSFGWDGTFRGQKAPIDSYIYIIEIICDNSMIIPIRGSVSLIR